MINTLLTKWDGKIEIDSADSSRQEKKTSWRKNSVKWALKYNIFSSRAEKRALEEARAGVLWELKPTTPE